MGPTGPTGPDGRAATITVSGVTTGDPGTEAQVINTGTDTDAVLEFVIPRGESGGAGTPEVLATVDSTDQASTAGGALVFNETPLVSGSAITHTPGSTDIVINQSGIYQATFQSTIAVATGTLIPASIEVVLTMNGTNVPGATARRTFTASGEVGTVAFSVPFQVTTPPAILQVIADSAGFVLEDIALTVFRLGA